MANTAHKQALYLSTLTNIDCLETKAALSSLQTLAFFQV